MVTLRLHLDDDQKDLGIALQASAGTGWQTLGWLQTDGAKWWRAGERVRGKKYSSLVTAIEALLDVTQFTTTAALWLGVGSE